MKKRNARKAISMGGQPNFSWQMQEDSQSNPVADQAVASPMSARSWLILASCALLVLLGGYLLWQQLNKRAESNLALVEAEVAEAFDPKRVLAGWQTQPLVATDSSRPPPAFMVGADGDVTLLELFGTLALVDITVNNPSEAWYDEPYHVARIVQQGADGWNQISPNNSFWSERRTLDTTYFHLEYGRRDQAAVQEVAARLDELYLQFLDDLGQPTPGRGLRISLFISVVEGSEVRVTDVRYSGNTLYIGPPELIPRPPTISNAETLRQAIAYPLSTKVFNAALSDLAIPCGWRSLGEGIGLWQRWENHTLPSRRHWEYERSIQQAVSGAALPTLSDLRSIQRDCWQPPPFLETDEINVERPFPRNELAATLIEYLVATYGRSSVAAVLGELQHSSDWNTLALKSVNVTADEVEAGWQHYLQQRTR